MSSTMAGGNPVYSAQWPAGEHHHAVGVHGYEEPPRTGTQHQLLVSPQPPRAVYDAGQFLGTLGVLLLFSMNATVWQPLAAAPHLPAVPIWTAVLFCPACALWWAVRRPPWLPSKWSSTAAEQVALPAVSASHDTQWAQAEARYARDIHRLSAPLLLLGGAVSFLWSSIGETSWPGLVGSCLAAGLGAQQLRIRRKLRQYAAALRANDGRSPRSASRRSGE